MSLTPSALRHRCDADKAQRLEDRGGCLVCFFTPAFKEVKKLKVKRSWVALLRCFKQRGFASMKLMAALNVSGITIISGNCLLAQEALEESELSGNTHWDLVAGKWMLLINNALRSLPKAGCGKLLLRQTCL